VTAPTVEKKLQDVRTGAIGLAASFYEDPPADLGQLWRLCALFEQFILTGAEGTRAEFGPKTTLRVIDGRQ
jgi:hypothetical protein